MFVFNLHGNDRALSDWTYLDMMATTDDIDRPHCCILFRSLVGVCLRLSH